MIGRKVRRLTPKLSGVPAGEYKILFFTRLKFEVRARKKKMLNEAKWRHVPLAFENKGLTAVLGFTAAMMPTFFLSFGGGIHTQQRHAGGVVFWSTKLVDVTSEVFVGTHMQI
ncbi:hypothetical protein TWF594_000868 [Orbilia oligospora]|nr:hypothetical protein TWF594_000868 [Orbilia oligospora]